MRRFASWSTLAVVTSVAVPETREAQPTDNAREARISYNPPLRRVQSPHLHHAIRSSGRGVAHADPCRRRTGGGAARAQRAGTGPSRARRGRYAWRVRDGAVWAQRTVITLISPLPRGGRFRPAALSDPASRRTPPARLHSASGSLAPGSRCDGRKRPHRYRV